MLGSYRAVALTSFKEVLTYRLNFLIALTNPFITLAVLWFVWGAIYASSPVSVIKGFTFPAMITYVSISTLISSYTYPNTEHVVEEEVRSGSVISMLIKPVAYPLFCFARDTGSIVIQLFTRAPFMAFAFVFFGISGPASWVFLVSALLGYIVNYFLVFLTAIWAFWITGYIWGIRYSRHIIMQITSGALIPLALFPDWMQGAFSLLPFQAIYHIPLSIYMGMISGIGIFTALATQLAWIGILLVITHLAWRATIRKVVIQGG